MIVYGIICLLTFLLLIRMFLDIKKDGVIDKKDLYRKAIPGSLVVCFIPVLNAVCIIKLALLYKSTKGFLERLIVSDGL